jgi:hypothetical protein
MKQQVMLGVIISFVARSWSQHGSLNMLFSALGVMVPK